jgi:hypothetical protein
MSARDPGIPSETLRKWVRRKEADEGLRPDLPTAAEREALKVIRRLNRASTPRWNAGFGRRSKTDWTGLVGWMLPKRCHDWQTKAAFRLCARGRARPGSASLGRRPVSMLPIVMTLPSVNGSRNVRSGSGEQEARIVGRAADSPYPSVASCVDAISTSRPADVAQALAELPPFASLPEHRAFERLAAIVLHRWLGERTVHDITLRGSSGAPHQIDVLVGDERQRALIECKYYGRAIDMPVARNFYGAVEDLGCDLAAIASTVGFSRNVRTYAAAKGIDLLLLRDTVDSDLDGRVRRIEMELTVFGAHLRACRVVAPPEAAVDEGQLVVNLTDGDCVIEHASGRRVPFVQRYHELHRSFGFDDPDGVYPITEEFEAST